MPKKKETFGDYRAAGLVLVAFIEASGGEWTTERIAAAVKAGNPRTVRNWINGESWPRNPEYRMRLRDIGVDVGQIDRAVCDTLALRPFAPSSLRLLEKFEAGDRELRDAIGKAIKDFEAREAKRSRK